MISGISRVTFSGLRGGVQIHTKKVSVGGSTRAMKVGSTQVGKTASASKLSEKEVEINKAAYQYLKEHPETKLTWAKIVEKMTEKMKK